MLGGREMFESGRKRTVKAPRAKTPTRMAFLLVGSFAARKMGIGIEIIMRSDEIFNTALVIRWFVAAEHWTTNSYSQSKS